MRIRERRPSIDRRAAGALLWLTLGGAPGCTMAVSPQPEPTCLGEPVLDVGRVQLEGSAQGSVLSGAPLAAGVRSCAGDDVEEPEPGAVLHVVHLDSQAPEVTAAIGAYGNFEVALPGAPTDVYRAHVSTLGVESAFVDISSPAGTALALAPCLRGHVQDFPEVSSGQPTVIEVTLSNECPASLSITEAALRLGDQGFAIVDDPVATVAEPLDSVTVRVRFEAASAGRYEDILLIRFAGGGEDRTAVTLRASVPE